MGLQARSAASLRLELTSPETELHNPQGPMGDHTVFLVDLGETDWLLPACCGQEYQRRGRRQRLSDLELEEQRRTRAELARLDQEAAAERQGPGPPVASLANE